MNIKDDLEIFGVVYNKQFEICKYIAENTNPSNNIFMGTYTKIMKDVGCSSATVSLFLFFFLGFIFFILIQNGAWLVNLDFIKKIKKGMWLINLNSEKGENK